MSTTTDPIFDTEPYEVPFPDADGRKVTDLALRLAGSLKLNRNNPDHAALVESLTLGRMLTITVTCSVDGKLVSLRSDADGGETVTHTVALKIHEVNEA